MASFTHTLVLTPVPRAWFDRAVATGWEVLSEHLGSATLPLVEGRPLTTGAHYASDDTTVTLDSWQRHGESAGRVTVTEDGTITTCHVRLSSAATPRAVQVEGGASDGGRWASGTGGFTVDLERWWTGRGTAVAGRFDHRVAIGTFEIGRATADPWQVEVTVRVRGRGVFRPLAAPALAIAHKRIQRGFADALDRFAVRWADEVPRYTAMPPDELRALLTAELAAG
jgi:hypothetical protein